MSPIPKDNHQEENDPDIQRIKILLKVLDIPWSKTKPSSTTYKRRCVVDTFGKCDFEVGFSENNKILFQINSRKSLTSNCLVGPYLVSKLKGSNWENEALDYYEGKNGNARGHKEGNGKQAKEGYIFVMEEGDPVDWNKMNEWKQRIKSGFKTFHDKLKEIDFSESKIKEFYDQNKNPDYDIDSYRDRITRRNASKVTSKEQEYTSRTGNNPMFTDIKALLESNHQVILTGAPGTGKTYTAKKVAMELAKDTWVVETDSSGKKIGKWQNGRIASVQFHPGYDYTDFVVGMKPVLVDGDNNVVKAGENCKGIQVSYQWTDGVFKKFAENAKNAFDSWVATAGHKPEDAPKFVFLIDEINRADLSRVFGELFSLLEEEYRYPNDDGSDSILLPDGKLFSIPKNLYIIGTMNDIDRSVESMDFALRRRFAWKEVKPENTMDDILREIPEKDTLRAKMKAVNDLIRSDERLGDQYQLGGAIFAKLEKYVERNKNGTPKRAKPEAFDHLWENHIQNILFEYLRGRSEPEKSLGDLKAAYKAQTHNLPSTKDFTNKNIKISLSDGTIIDQTTIEKPGERPNAAILRQFITTVYNRGGNIEKVVESPEIFGGKKFLIRESEFKQLEDLEKRQYAKEPIQLGTEQYREYISTNNNQKVKYINAISDLLDLGVEVDPV